jgi:uncharacterized protein Yka (UPF0111/DUF47 family)
MISTIIVVVLLMILQFLLLQNYMKRSLMEQTEKVELILKSASSMEKKIDEIKENINAE